MSWTIKKAECQRVYVFKLWCWRRLLNVPWRAKKSNQSMLREINHEYSLEGLMLKLKPVFTQYDAHRWLIGKVPDAGKDRGQKEKRVSEHEVAGWHYWCNEHELGQAPGDGEGQRSLECCSPWGRKGSDTTGWLNNNILDVYALYRLESPFTKLHLFWICWSDPFTKTGAAKHHG